MGSYVQPTKTNKMAEEKMEFDDEQKKAFRKNFNLFDKKRTGKIPLADMGTVLRANGQNPTEARMEELLQMARECDANNDEHIEFEEFLDLMAKTNKTPEEMRNEIMDAFLVFDADGSGYIDRTELKEQLTKLGEKVDEAMLDEMLDEADKDKDGKINYEEFCTVMMQ